MAKPTTEELDLMQFGRIIHNRPGSSHGMKIADAIVNYVNAQDVRYAERPRALHAAYHNLVWAIDEALKKE